ncbi:TNT domain-containing protein [Mycobacterium sp. 663a-19]|uniref:TNT domain-containing protein n=1 Tax=Mycobacterium sp. 663a-19 TaxID=2986148 RepID=UPI002D1F3402|nr:TNT domain-containing protein [Mycobacterium sp. 663a-19]MEB3980851.1 TNT domain-containing protein [Mycobacterium sp. 663a-19]
MQLRYISIALLVAEAGGDPCAINKSLQAGRPAQISDLAEAFHAAGRCTTEANAAFDEARRRFEAAWNRENGEHPINDSAEVQFVVRSLGAQSLQLPKIGVDLENIAAALAEAQGSASGQIATLEDHLQRLDDLIGQALDEEDDPDVTPDEMAQLEAFIGACEEDAIKDTQATLAQIQLTRDGYTGCLQKSLQNLRGEGYDPAAIHGVDSDPAPPPSALQSGELTDLRQVTNQAVVDQMGKVRAAQDAVDKALATLYTKGPGSPEGEAAAQSLPKLKADLARAIDDLGKIPDYNTIDPASVSTTADGRFMFTYNVDGQPVQVVGQLKNGAGEFFDQATGTSYTFKDGKLTGMRTLDPGKVEATPEPLWSVITLAVGGPELKAGGEAAWQGLKTLFSREALMTGLTSDNVLPRALSAAEARAAIAQADLPPRTLPGAGGEPLPGAHPGPSPVVEHTPPGGQGGGIAEHAPGEHLPVPDVPHTPPPVVDQSPPPPLPSDHPLFHGYQPIEPGPEFTRPDGSLIYPDDSLPTKPYAVPGTVMPDAQLPEGTVLSRFGYPGGSYMAAQGTPFAELSLPPDSALKPYFQYVVDNPEALPRGYHIEESEVAPWFHQPGGGTQYRVIGPDGKDAPVDALLESGYLKEVRK